MKECMAEEGVANGGKFQCDVGVIIMLRHVANERGIKSSAVTL